MIARRRLLGSTGALAGLASLGGLAGLGDASASDYRALVVLMLEGGYDGHHTLVPTDGAFNDYVRARTNLAMSRASLVNLPGSSAGHTFALHPSLALLAPLYERGRLAFIANAGPLLQPCTAAQVIAQQVRVPPFLMAHPEQMAVQAGWLTESDNDTSGWGGRTLELLPSSLRHRLAALKAGRFGTTVNGRNSTPTELVAAGTRWGSADLLNPASQAHQQMASIGRWQFGNDYQSDYARQFAQAFDDAVALTKVLQRATPPQADFENNPLARTLRDIAMAIPQFKAIGYRRQIYQVSWGTFDTHSEQRGNGPFTQDTQFTTLAKALASFDQANIAAGLDSSVALLVLSDFGRTLRPNSGGGSEHAWGNHLFAIGGPIAGGQVLGTFPTLMLGGPDDSDTALGGRFVPTTPTDQIAASLMQWLGLPPAQFDAVFPNLVNFQQKTIPLLRS